MPVCGWVDTCREVMLSSIDRGTRYCEYIQYIVSICVMLLKKASLDLHLVDPVNATTQAAARPIEQ